MNEFLPLSCQIRFVWLDLTNFIRVLNFFLKILDWKTKFLVPGGTGTVSSCCSSAGFLERRFDKRVDHWISWLRREISIKKSCDYLEFNFCQVLSILLGKLSARMTLTLRLTCSVVWMARPARSGTGFRSFLSGRRGRCALKKTGINWPPNVLDGRHDFVMIELIINCG